MLKRLKTAALLASPVFLFYLGGQISTHEYVHPTGIAG
jgi:hypothetical protein